MRYPRVRRLLGPLEPGVRAGYHWWRAQVARMRRRALVVLATDPATDPAAALAAALAATLDGRIGVWVCTDDDVAPRGSAGWFVVRLDPTAVASPSVRRDEVATILATWRRACRQVDVLDLDA